MLDSLKSVLPPHLEERTRLVSTETNPSQKSGQFVLYWMRTAMRLEENPALDVAALVANDIGLPLLVYQGLSQHYPFASDRHHIFILQGARDVQRQAEAKGIRYVFHLESELDREPHLSGLADQSAVVVTEDMPVDPPRLFLRSLRRRTKTPILAVDTACVAPMRLVKKPYTRAFQFRSATKKLYQERLTRDWPAVDAMPSAFEAKLSLQSVELRKAEISELVARCQIDHSIGAVVDTEGGSTAGYRRWDEFNRQGLSKYARRRNDALQNGVSRMSAYLHYGMVSPFRIARQAAEMENAGSEKYLDELLIWRELAYCFCFHRPDHDRWSALPDWAQETLEKHASDRRPKTYSWEQLARAQTDDRLWNAAQLSLLRQGELHNNVRMTWGKAILQWCDSPRTALKTIIDLNHRYALDGRDPASYGGILWCLGQFDRPFEPEREILGVVRSRPTLHHAARLDVEAYSDRVSMPRFEPIPQVAIVGAGLSGLAAARTLTDHGLPVKVFEKSRGVGGRMSTRRVDEENHFDHGAQYFTARDPRFRRFVDSWIEQGLVQAWPDGANLSACIVAIRDGEIESESASTNRFVAVPGMNSICQHLAEEQSVSIHTHVARVQHVGERIQLIDDQGETLGEFDRLIVSIPAAQSAELLTDYATFSEPLSKIKMNPSWALMVSFDQPVTDQWSGAFLNNSFLSWVARNSSKPGRVDRFEQLVIHARADWTESHWDNDRETITQMILDEFWRVTGLQSQVPVQSSTHRWRYALPTEPMSCGCLFDASLGIAACGDWANTARVEGAFLSGMAAAGRVLGTLSAPLVTRQEQQILF